MEVVIHLDHTFPNDSLPGITLLDSVLQFHQVCNMTQDIFWLNGLE